MRAFCTALLSDPYLYRFLSKRYAHAALIVPVLCNRLQRKKIIDCFLQSGLTTAMGSGAAS